jgi:hypothetical protein
MWVIIFNKIIFLAASEAMSRHEDNIGPKYFGTGKKSKKIWI